MRIKNLILCVCLLMAQEAFCYTLTSDNLSKIVSSKVQNEVNSLVSNYSNDVKINITGLTKENIETHENSMPNIDVIPKNMRFQPNTYKRVVIKDSNNNIIKAFPINIEAKVYKEVLVANTLIPFNTEINKTNTILQKRDISKYLGRTLDYSSIGTVSKRSYQKGNIILSNSIQEKASVLKNSTVNIVFVSDHGLNIKLQGKALKEGAIGDTILVRSNKYNKMYNAKIISQNEVIVRI